MSDFLNITPAPCCGPEDDCAPAADPVNRDAVRDYYAAAAEAPQEQLCCPTKYSPVDVDHIPEEVLAISYGCGSPIGVARPLPGQTVVDLGSGGGIDCFIATRHVDPEGRVIGVDMTDEMLAKARANADKVHANLGYAVTDFRKGFLEQVPVGDAEVDLVTSNCVLNLSPDKAKVFGEIHRVLRHGGRFVISDIVAERPVPLEMARDKELWGECISGAVTEREFVALAEEAGFHGITLEREYTWQEVGGIKFYSTLFSGHRFDKNPTCDYRGHAATYLGPGRVFHDDDGHAYTRGDLVEVCSDTAQKLAAAPYAGMFVVTGPGTGGQQASGGCC